MSKRWLLLAMVLGLLMALACVVPVRGDDGGDDMDADVAGMGDDEELAAEEVPEPPQQPQMTEEEQRANMEAMERLFARVDPECRTEFEMLMQQQTDAKELSDNCKAQLNAAVQLEQDFQAGSDNAQAAPKKELATGWAHPGVAITIFLILLMGAVTWYLVWWHREVKPHLKPYKEPKQQRKMKRR